MNKKFKKQIITGITGAIGTILLAVATFTFFDLSMWIMLIIFAAFIGNLLGFFIYIFSGKEGYFMGAKYGVGLVAIIAASRLLPSWIFGIFILTLIFIFFVLPLIKEYKIDREKNSKTIIDKKIAAAIKSENESIKKIGNDADEIKKLIGFGEKSILLLTSMGTIYQLIRGKEKIFFIRIGGELSGIDIDFIRRDFTDESASLNNKKDFYISANDIAEIKCKYGKSIKTDSDSCGNITFKTNRKNYAFSILDNLPIEQIQAFFSSLPFSIIKNKKIYAEPTKKQLLSEEEKRVLPILKKVCLILMIISIISSVVFFLFPINKTIYIVFSIICTLIPAITFALYIKFNTLLSLDDRDENNSSNFKKTSINIYMPLLFPSMALGLRSLIDFNIIDEWTFVIYSFVIFVVIMLIFFKFTKEYKHLKSIIIIMVFAVLIYSPSVTAQINCLYDFSTPVINSTKIINKYISDGEETSYYFTIKLNNGEQADLSVSQDFYEKHNNGSTVTVAEKPGLLGIKYAYVKELK